MGESPFGCCCRVLLGIHLSCICCVVVFRESEYVLNVWRLYVECVVSWCQRAVCTCKGDAEDEDENRMSEEATAR